MSNTAPTNTPSDAGMQASVISKSTWQNNSPQAIHSTAEATPPKALMANSAAPTGATKNSRVVVDTTMAAASTTRGVKGVRR